MAQSGGENYSPVHLRNVPMATAIKGRDFYNVESTYNKYANDQAFSHLSALHHYVGMIGEHPEIQQNPANANTYGQVREAISTAIRHHNSGFVGDTIEEIQSGTGLTNQQGQPTNVGARAHVGAAGQLLGTIKATHPALQEMLGQAQKSVENYKAAYTPATLDTNAKNKRTTNNASGASVIVDPDYRKHISAQSGKIVPWNPEAYAQMSSEEKQSYSQELAKSGTVDGNYAKRGGGDQKRSAEARARKNEQTKARNKAKRAAMRAARAAQPEGN